MFPEHISIISDRILSVHGISFIRWKQGSFMTIQLVLAVSTLLLLYLVPGYLLLRTCGLNRIWSLCLAPLPSIGILCMIGQVFATIGVSVDAIVMIMTSVIPLLCAFIAIGKKAITPNLPTIDWWVPLVYVGIGLGLTYSLFLGRLVRLEQIMQAFDTTHAVGLIRSFANAGRYSSLGVGYYLEDANIDPFPGSMFYPASWHMLCALTVRLTGVSVPLAINASQFVSVAIVYPLSVCALMAAIFNGDRNRLIAGSLACLAFVYFPWVFLIFGPIYPNMAAFAVLPGILSIFICMTMDDVEMRHRILLFVAFLLGGLGLATLHPNAVFTAAVFLGPYCAWRIWITSRAKYEGYLLPAAFVLGFVVLFFGIWYGCFKAPMFRAIVWESWWFFTKEWQELINILTLSYTFGHWYEFAAQIPLALALILGVACAFNKADQRWLIVSYGFACLILMVCTTREGEFKHFLSGFWYCDHLRIAGMCCICGTPLATLGLAWIYEQIVRLTRLYNGNQNTNVVKIAVFCSLLFMTLNFLPEFDMPGAYFDTVLNEGLNDDPDPREFERWTEERKRYEGRKYHSFHTTFGDYRTAFAFKTISDNPVTENERQFLFMVKNIVGNDDLIINNPMDGSFLAYGFNNLRVYYRSFVHYGWAETPESELIRTNLVNMSTNSDVRKAVDAIDAKYVLIMSESWSDLSYINLRGNYSPTRYQGISSITPDTPGFELVISQEVPYQNFYLYRILPE